MEIRLAELREGVPQRIREIFDPKKLDLEFVDLVYDGGIECDGEAEKGAETVSFSGNLKGSLQQVCGRCLKTIRSEFSKPFRFYYEIKDRDVVEVLDDLREVLILDHPVTFLCKDSCKGLCPECGIDLNEAGCRCQKKEEPEHLTSLKEFWNKKKEEKKNAKS
jgi:uncharacterized protein